MELQTISQISKGFNISTRTLRYYEQIGLIRSTKKADYAYRSYDEEAVRRLRQIVVLRKLRIPLKQIGIILESEDTTEILSTFQQNLLEVNDEITALSTIKTILQTFIARLSESTDLDITLNLLDDVSILNVVDSLTVTKVNFKENTTMGDLNKASERLKQLTDRDVRIIYLPPMTVASLHIMGGEAEIQAALPLREFIQSVDLIGIKPDFRHFGFNHPDGKLPDGSDHGYERWLSIPDDLEVPEQFTKKQFSGGLYAAHMIPMGSFEEWHSLYKWVSESQTYQFAGGDPECMHGLLEEHLNFFNQYTLPGNDDSIQIDLLMPIKEQ